MRGNSGMMRQKRRARRRAALGLLVVLPLVLLSVGCRLGKKQPFYQLEKSPEIVLTVEGIRYLGGGDVVRHPAYSSGLFWKFTGEIGDAIGVCGGKDPERGGGYDVCRIKGDAEQRFLYILPNHFVFGPYLTYFCVREDLQILPPSVETVGPASFVYQDEEDISAQVNDPAMIASLLEAFDGDSVGTLAGENRVYGSLLLSHREYPFLQCELECCYLPEKGAAYCRNEGGEWVALPGEWGEIISS